MKIKIGHCISLLSLLAVASTLLSSCAGSTGPQAVAPGSAGSQSIFNGTDLTGWNGDPLFWRVENGAIVGQTTDENPTQVNTFLILEEPIENFTLTLDLRLSNHNTGIQYRSKVLEGWKVAGYQADFDENNRFTGQLYEEGGRGFIARRGQKVVMNADGVPEEIGLVGDADELATRVKVGDWNHYEIIAMDNHLIHKVNGYVTADATDNDVNGRSLKGILAFQLHAGPSMKVEYKNIKITRY